MYVPIINVRSEATIVTVPTRSKLEEGECRRLCKKGGIHRRRRTNSLLVELGVTSLETRQILRQILSLIRRERALHRHSSVQLSIET